MAATEKSSAKRFGVRYGRKLREKVGKIEKERRQSNVCPYCHYKRIKRIAAGIWVCDKCKSKFAGGAYVAGRKAEETQAGAGAKTATGAAIVMPPAAEEVTAVEEEAADAEEETVTVENG